VPDAGVDPSRFDSLLHLGATNSDLSRSARAGQGRMVDA
jgi:hypothetical protein